MDKKSSFETLAGNFWTQGREFFAQFPELIKGPAFSSFFPSKECCGHAMQVWQHHCILPDKKSKDTLKFQKFEKTHSFQKNYFSSKCSYERTDCSSDNSAKMFFYKGLKTFRPMSDKDKKFTKQRKFFLSK